VKNAKQQTQTQKVHINNGDANDDLDDFGLPETD
jgi:hypothetical protein